MQNKENNIELISQENEINDNNILNMFSLNQKEIGLIPKRQENSSSKSKKSVNCTNKSPRKILSPKKVAFNQCKNHILILKKSLSFESKISLKSKDLIKNQSDDLKNYNQNFIDGVFQSEKKKKTSTKSKFTSKLEKSFDCKESSKYLNKNKYNELDPENIIDNLSSFSDKLDIGKYIVLHIFSFSG